MQQGLCSVCCNQMVPVSIPEARRLLEVVAEMPAEQRQRVERRFAETVRRLEESGLAEAVRAPVEGGARGLGLRYFALGLPCPFLDHEGACGIHAERPMACREYLVASPPPLCASPIENKVDALVLPVWGRPR